MPLLDIRVLGDPILREETIPISEVTDELRTLMDNMFETMHAAEGIGLAAPQVGRRERMTVIEIEGTQYVLINPEIVDRQGSDKAEEGCLSIPDVFADIERPSQVVVRALDRDLVPFELSADKLLARCIQHEVDHLFGTLFIDHLSILKRRTALAKWTKEKQKYPALVRRMSEADVAPHRHRDEEL